MVLMGIFLLLYLLAFHLFSLGKCLFRSFSNGLDLAREDIDAADDQHIVAAAHGLGHAHMGAAAGAGRAVQHAQIAGPVAQEREGFLVQRGENQFADGAFRQDFACIRVDDFSVEVVLVDVHAALLFALESHPGAAGFRAPSALQGEGLIAGTLGRAQHCLPLTSCMHQILMGYFLEEHNPYIEEV